MPSLLADPSGKIDTRFTLEGVTLGGADGFVGHAVDRDAGGRRLRCAAERKLGCAHRLRRGRRQ